MPGALARSHDHQADMQQASLPRSSGSSSDIASAPRPGITLDDLIENVRHAFTMFLLRWRDDELNMRSTSEAIRHALKVEGKSSLGVQDAVRVLQEMEASSKNMD